MSDLPEGWFRALLAEVAQWGSGGTPSRNNASYYGGNIPWIKTGELGQGLITDTEEKITELGLQNSSAKIFPKGSVAVAMYGATIGKTAILGIDAATNQACAVGIPRKEVTSTEYLFHYLYSQKNAFIEVGQGGAQPNISQTVIKNWPIPLAPLNEQKRIADKLDRILSRVDACREKCDRIPLILKRFRQSVLTAATSGELTQDWREEHSVVEPVTSLVKEKKFTLDDSNEDLPLLPDSWEWVALGNYAQCSRGRFSIRPRNDPSYFNGEYPFIQIGDLSSEGGWINAHKQTLNVKGLAVSKKFPKATVVIAIVGATIGNTGLLAYDMCFPDSMVGIETGNEISNRYIELFLCHRKEDIRQISYAGGGQPNIKLETLNPYPLALPPIEEQREIVRRVETLFAYADRLEAQYQKAREHIDRLTPAILDKAFRGELVPQDPNDEPASTLLERIQISRASTEKSQKKQLKTNLQSATQRVDSSA